MLCAWAGCGLETQILFIVCLPQGVCLYRSLNLWQDISTGGSTQWQRVQFPAGRAGSLAVTHWDVASGEI